MHNRPVDEVQQKVPKETPKTPTSHPKTDDKLSEYASKRNFQATPEPKGKTENPEPLIYVIQEHHASHLH